MVSKVIAKNGTQMEISFDLFRLKQQLQLATGKEFSFSEIARQADLHRNTVERLAANKIDRIDLVTLAKLLLFFRGHGIDINVGDLFSVKEIPENKTGD